MWSAESWPRVRRIGRAWRRCWAVEHQQLAYRRSGYLVKTAVDSCTHPETFTRSWRDASRRCGVWPTWSISVGTRCCAISSRRTYWRTRHFSSAGTWLVGSPTHWCARRWLICFSSSGATHLHVGSWSSTQGLRQTTGLPKDFVNPCRAVSRIRCSWNDLNTILFHPLLPEHHVNDVGRDTDRDSDISILW